jgi:hypothetical protein
MVSRVGGWLGDRRMPDKFPDWLTEADIDFYAGEFKRAGFRGGLNWYRNIDRNWELMAPFAGAKVEVPALFMTGDKDLVYRSPGVEQLVANLAQFVPKLKKTVILPGCGHWTQEERKDDVNRELVAFLKGLCDQWGGLRWASQFRSLAAKRCRCPAEASGGWRRRARGIVPAPNRASFHEGRLRRSTRRALSLALELPDLRLGAPMTEAPWLRGELSFAIEQFIGNGFHP